ncbi:MAG: Bcr/CflA family efflux MFS transporter [Rickettsiales bacterium]|nr:Bcr/CflA family efflux MFS transporter [Rickettsiales bacterium]
MSKHKTYLIFLILLSLIGQGSITTFVPGLPTIATDLNIRNSVAAELTSSYLLGLAVTSLIVGAISDRYGRKKVIIISSIIYTLSSAFSIFLDNILYLSYLRFLQALGGGALLIMSHAIVTDCYTQNNRTKVLSIIYPMITISPPIGMLIGGLITNIFEWKTIYIFLSCCSLAICTFAILCFQETKQASTIQPIKPSILIKNYLYILKNPVFIGYTTLNCLTATIIYSYFADAPFILMDLNMSAAEIGYLIASTSFGVVIGNFICNQTLNILSFNKITTIAITIILCGALFLFATTYDGAQDTSEVIIPFFVISIGIGIIIPLLVSKVSHEFESIEGSTLGLYNFFRAITCAATTRYVGEFTSQDPNNMSIYITIFALFMIITFGWITFYNKKHSSQ